MESLLNIINMNYTNVIKMSIFNFLKTGNPMYDAIISTIAISLFGYLMNSICENYNFIKNISIFDIKELFYRKNSIIIEGKKSSIVSSYSLSHNVTTVYSNRFKAIWNYIIVNIERYKSINTLKEYHSNFQSSNEEDGRRKNVDIFMVYQNKCFIIDEDIFVKTIIEQEESKDDKEKVNSKTDTIIITIYSYKYSINYLKNYVDNITDKYLSSIKEKRSNKRYIYCLEKVIIKDEESILNCWSECFFESTRTFNNIFFDGKDQLRGKIDFFLQNKDWYYEKGIPYTLGIGLHGPPGTGKTSLIKALANYTERHIVFISLKMFKTKGQLDKFFFENTYNSNNEIATITFDKKIIVFEDIDCIGEIILDRDSNKKHVNCNTKNNTIDKNIEVNTDEENIKIKDVLNGIRELNSSSEMIKVTQQNVDPPITLDDILNLWDGIRETPGRILIITSNHYDKLDPALIRPGRIDITHELSNASHNTISQIYFHLFGNNIDPNILKDVSDLFYTPAELINIYIGNKTEEEFVKRLLQNKKI